MTPTRARRNLSTVVPCGMNSGSMIEAMKRMVISGTARMSSMKAMQSVLMTGILDCRPSARMMPSGKDKVMPTTEMMRVTRRPPHFSVGIGVRPKTPPASRK
ncbi:hypothetical protein D3C72_1801200 [compost metagenome]